MEFGQRVDENSERVWLWDVLRFHEAEVAKYRRCIQVLEGDPDIDEEDKEELEVFCKRVVLGESVIAECKRILAADTYGWLQARKQARMNRPKLGVRPWDDASNKDIIEAYDRAAHTIREGEETIALLVQKEASNVVFLEQLENDVKYYEQQIKTALSRAIKLDAQEQLALVKKFILRTRVEQKKLAAFIDDMLDGIDKIRAMVPLN